MRRISPIGAMFSLSVCLTGCGIGLGLFPKSSYETLHPRPYRDSWEKPGMTEASRAQDWVVCGGDADGGSSMHVKRMLPGETNEQADIRQEFALQRCMIRAGYRYTGNCGSAYAKTQPSCGAP